MSKPFKSLASCIGKTNEEEKDKNEVIVDVCSHHNEEKEIKGPHPSRCMLKCYDPDSHINLNNDERIQYFQTVVRHTPLIHNPISDPCSSFTHSFSDSSINLNRNHSVHCRQNDDIPNVNIGDQSCHVDSSARRGNVNTEDDEFSQDSNVGLQENFTAISDEINGLILLPLGPNTGPEYTTMNLNSAHLYSSSKSKGKAELVSSFRNSSIKQLSDGKKSLWSSLISKKAKNRTKNSCKEGNKKSGATISTKTKTKDIELKSRLNNGCSCCTFHIHSHTDHPECEYKPQANLCFNFWNSSEQCNHISSLLDGNEVLNEIPHILTRDCTILNGMNTERTLQIETIARPLMCSKDLRGYHSQVNYTHYLVPGLLDITNCQFYWGKMNRYGAELLIDNKPEGTFLLRDSAQDEYLFSVSFCRHQRSLHARIEQSGHRFSFDPLDPGVFSSDSVIGLLEYYKDPSCCMFYDPVLTNPLRRIFTFPLQHLCRATICSRVSYDGINQLLLPKKIKNYLKEYHYKHKVSVRHLD